MFKLKFMKLKIYNDLYHLPEKVGRFMIKGVTYKNLSTAREVLNSVKDVGSSFDQITREIATLWILDPVPRKIASILV